MLDFVSAAVLAIVQGITAWIPVSSKTQVVLAGNWLFSLTFAEALAFAILLHIGDLIAALFKYRKEYMGALGMVASGKVLTLHAQFLLGEDEREKAFLITSLIATAIVALPFYWLVKKVFADLTGEPLLFVIGLLLIAMALITIQSRKKAVQAKPLTFATAVIAGAAQGLAVVPGISRSGITQCAMLLHGVEAPKAMRLSFLMAAPMIALAIPAFLVVEGSPHFPLTLLALGIAISAIVSYFTMDALTALARRIPAHVFLIAIGLLSMVPLAIKMISGLSG